VFLKKLKVKKQHFNAIFVFYIKLANDLTLRITYTKSETLK